MLSDSENRKNYRIKKRAISADNMRWSDDQKIEAVKMHLVFGSVEKAAAACKIPWTTVRYWSTQKWWKDMRQELELSENLELSAKLKSIVAKSLTVVEDRLENGNHMYDQKTGTLVRVPVNIKDAARAALDSMATKTLLEKSNVNKTEDDVVENKLKELAERFALMAANKFNEIKQEERTVNVTDVVELNPYSEDDEDDFYGPIEDEPEDPPDVDFADHVGVGQVKPYKKEK